MSDPRPLNRKDLAKFLPDQRSIRAFEELFNLIPSELEISTSENATSEAKSNQNSSLVLEALTELRSTKVLLWLSI